MANNFNQSQGISQANKAYYDQGLEKDYVDGTPHIKHKKLFGLYISCVEDVFYFSKQNTVEPKVLDLGAGEGSATLPFLALGAHVTAVDISEIQLKQLENSCRNYLEQVRIQCQDINDFLAQSQESYDIVVVNSFLHHIPDYLSLIQNIIPILNPHGQFFSFQDPIRYDTAGKFTMAFSNLAYFSWRVLRGDILGGIRRRLRRRKGIYLVDSPHDNAEYHVTRNGVDQFAIYKLLSERQFDCRLINYFSTQSSFFQPIGSLIGINNTFGIIARKNG